MNNEKGAWALLFRKNTLAEAVVKDFEKKGRHHLELRFTGKKLEVLIDRSRVARVDSRGKGRGLLANFYDLNLFDNVQIVPINEILQAYGK